MHIRCERCSTVYELDEKLIPADGALVQCTRCDHVFTAKPPRGAEAAVAAPCAPLPVTPPPAPASIPAQGRSESEPLPEEVPPAPEPPRSEAKASTARTVPAPPWARPVSSGAAARPTARPSAYGPSVQRMRSTRRGGSSSLRWLGAALVVIALLALSAWAVHAFLQRRADPGAAAKRKEGHTLLLRDDAGSIAAAAEAFAAASSLDGALYQAEADVALARVLELSDLSWEGGRLQAAFARGNAELARLRAEKPPGFERREAELSARQKAVTARYDELREQGTRREASAKGILSSVLRDHPGDVAVLRALALYHALGGQREPAAQVLARADAAKVSDPWLELARAGANASAKGEPARRERGIAALLALANANPEFLRARLLAARALVEAEHRDEALRALAELLRRNPQHDGARALALELASLPAVQAPVVRAAAAERPLATAARNPSGLTR